MRRQKAHHFKTATFKTTKMPILRNLVLSLCASPAFGDFLGPRYIPPVDLTSSESVVAAAWKNVTSTIGKVLEGNGTEGLGDTTFSIGMFSLRDPSASKLQFHHTSAEIAASNGTHKVDADSIYKVASISKPDSPTIETLLTATKPRCSPS